MAQQPEASEENKKTAVYQAAKILHFLVTNKSHKLVLAQERRKRLKNLISQGKTPQEDPRLNWIRDSSSELFGWLADRAEEYEKLEPADTILAADLMDVLSMATAKLKKKIKEIQEAAEEEI